MEQRFNCLLVGAGQLGSRYLQGLMGISQSLDIDVIDTSTRSLSIARQRLSQVPRASDHRIRFSPSLDVLSKHVDLAFIVTPAHCRSDLIRAISSGFHVNSWILEKILAQSTQQLDLIRNSLRSNRKVWVNTPRRLMVWHQSIRAQLFSDGPSPLQVRVHGGSWGLACNAIHFIDLVAWWTQASVRSVIPSGLGEWFKSKRVGFYEVCGSLVVTYEDGSVLELCCHSGQEPTQISVLTSQGEWLVEESLGRCQGANGQQLYGQLNLQSAITGPLVKQILQNGNCDLPTLSESTAQHRPFLETLQNHWNESHGCQDSIVPIT